MSFPGVCARVLCVIVSHVMERGCLGKEMVRKLYWRNYNLLNQSPNSFSRPATGPRFMKSPLNVDSHVILLQRKAWSVSRGALCGTEVRGGVAFRHLALGLETHDSQSPEFFALDSSSLKARRTSFDNPSAVVLKRKGDGE
ncbi:hypothetical protein POTOM_010615 [Populus tomentosa]|uniref:Uncharacterized protein n=1 Tax=Populus tomentosa TaxID=118781 RepID=A0A8X8ADX1_POPTO|nr:hypothetical protein POTOM_010615 [Populus tomentosa]